MSRFVKLFVVFALCHYLALALPISSHNQSLEARQRRRKGKQAASTTTGTGNTATGGNSRATTATDGSTILDDTVTVNGLDLRFKVSAPAEQFIANGATGNATLGINVLFHGDGGQSFVDFPNQGVNAGLMGVALLAPDPNFRWGGQDRTDATGLVRPDGPEHSAAVNQFLTTVLPTIVNFDANKIFLEGVSGGSLLLSGFMIPAFASSLNVQGAVLGCGGLAPEVTVQGDISGMRLHFQSTQNDLPALQTSIPQAITAYEDLITDTTLLTADASPNGGHCEFDEQDFVSGVQLLSDNFANIINGNAQLNGVQVANSVVGNENLFG